ncbi:MAG TPA: nucleotide pyrophosphohydrolase, partial [Mucilaginibacter sp.]|nr:nucleotide pyrophosphohydrolase [Mucilaginibacter sp.]
MKDWEKLQKLLIQFRDERDWAQFHNAKDLALALSIEASELNELFLWKKPEEVSTEKVKEELADVFGYVLL